MAYIGNEVTQSTFTSIEYTATADQTTFPSSGALPETAVNAASAMVKVNGLVSHTSSYSISTTLIFSAGLDVGDKVEVIWLGLAGSLSLPADNTVTNAKIARAGTSGQVLTSSGTGADVVWGAVAGGLSTFSQWRLTADATGNQTPLSSDLAEVTTPTGAGKKGDSMTQTSGVFEFPSTGYWLIKFHILFEAATNSVYNKFKIETTVDHTAGPTWAVACESSGATGGASQEQGQTTEYIFAVTDITERRCRFISGPLNNATTKAKGNADINETFFTFMKLGDI